MNTNKKRRCLRRVIVTSTALVVALSMAAAVSAATQVAPVNTTAPTISGTAKVGQTLTAGDGTWSNTPTSYAYQWLRCNGGGNSCVNVANGTQKTYTLVGADAGTRCGCGSRRPTLTALLRLSRIRRRGRAGNVDSGAEEHRRHRRSPAPRRSVRR